MVENVVPCGDDVVAGWATGVVAKVSTVWGWVWTIEPFPQSRWASTRPGSAKEQLGRTDPFLIARGPF